MWAISRKLTSNPYKTCCRTDISLLSPPLVWAMTGTVYNINADIAAAEIASALKAENIITLTDIRGLMADVNDEKSLIPVVKVSDVQALIQKGIISGGMIPKVRSCEKAVRFGVKKAVMIDGRIPHSILIEMFSDEGIGTMFVQ